MTAQGAQLAFAQFKKGYHCAAGLRAVQEGLSLLAQPPGRETGSTTFIDGQSYSMPEGHLSAVPDGPAATPPTVGFSCVDQVFPFGTITLADVSIILASVGKTRQSQGFDFQTDLDWNGAITYLDVSRELAAAGLTPCPGQLDRYTYDGMGTMAKRAHYAPGATTPSSWTEYIDGIYEKTDTGAITKYYYAFGRRVAMRSPSGTLSYLLADHLGSTVGAIDSTGAVTTQTYWPFGGTRTAGALGTDKQYTGQQVEPGDSSLGLYNYKARLYSTVLGRFASVDPVMGSAGDPQSWNPYTYVLNNPMAYVDPTGMCLTDMDGPRGCGLDPVASQSSNAPACDQACQDWTRGVTEYLQIQKDAEMAASAVGTLKACWPCGVDEIGQIYEYAAEQYGHVFDLIGKCAMVLPGCALAVSATSCVNGSNAACLETGVGAALVVGGEAFFLAKFKISLPERAGGYGDPLAGTTRAQRVWDRMAEDPAFHGFPDELDALASRGTTMTVIGGDGEARTLIRTPGTLLGHQGTFEWMVDRNDVVVHRFFSPK